MHGNTSCYELPCTNDIHVMYIVALYPYHFERHKQVSHIGIEEITLVCEEDTMFTKGSPSSQG